MASLPPAASLSLPPAPPAQLLDIQSLPSLEKFDSQLLDLIKASNEAGAAGINVMDELQAPDDDVALRRLFSLTQHTNSVTDDDLALQRLMSLTRVNSRDAFAGFFAQQQQQQQQQGEAAAAAAAEYQAARRAAASQHLRGQLQHHQLLPGSNPQTPAAAAAGGTAAGDLATLAEYMRATQQQQLAVASQAQAEYMALLAAQQGQQAAQQYQQDYGGMYGGNASLADALSSQAGLSAYLEQLRAQEAMGVGAAAGGGYGAQGGGTSLSAALTNLGLPGGLLDGPSSAAARRGRANRGGHLTDYIKVEQAGTEEGEGYQNEASIQAAAAAMAAALQGGGGAGCGGSGDSHDSAQSPHHAKRRKGANGAIGSGDSDYEGDLHDTSHLHITADMDEETKVRLRREKNRIAARKCRAKKNAMMNDLQSTLAGLMRKNEEYKMQTITWQKMFQRELNLREAMKRIVAVMWSADVPPAATGYTAHDIIIGVESGTLDINSVLRSLSAVSAASNAAATPTAAQAAAAAAAAGLATPAPLSLNRSMSAAANTPRSPGAAAATESVLAAAAAAAAAGGADAAAGGSPAVSGLVPQHLLMSHSSHISHSTSQHMPNTPHTPQAAEHAAMVMSAAAAGGGAGAGAGAGAGPGGALGSPIPSVAAAALVDLAGSAAAGAAGQGFGGLEAGWSWGVDGGISGAPSQVGPSCITTGME